MMQIHITAITFRMLSIAANAHRCTANCMVSSRHYNWIYKLFCIRTPLCAFHARRTHHGTSLAHDGIIHTTALSVCILREPQGCAHVRRQRHAGRCAAPLQEAAGLRMYTAFQQAGHNLDISRNSVESRYACRRACPPPLLLTSIMISWPSSG